MAEPTQSPALPSTADAVPYVPISWTAVAAVVVAGLFALVLLVLGITAFTNKKPLLAEELLVLPVIAVVLSFAARRMIRNSEGTRTGEGLADAAWWTALVLGLGYSAYLAAISFSVRREAATTVEQWAELVREGENELAFYQTLPPGARQGVAKTDRALLKARFRDELLAFNGADLLKLAQRNKGELTFAPTGVVDWSYKPGTIDCTFAGVMTCPEGRFPVTVPLKGVEGLAPGESGGRQWMIVRPQGGGFVQQDRVERTNYGWLVVLLELNGGAFAKTFIDHVGLGGPTGHPYLYRAFVAESRDPGAWAAVVRNHWMHIAFAAPLGITQPGTHAGRIPDGFFTLPGGVEPTAAQRERFIASWSALGLFEAGTRLKDAAGNAPDKESTLKITDTAVELYVPVELPVPSTGKMETARGRVVVACKDPALLAELKRSKAAAASEKPSISPPVDLERWATAPWRVVRIESDLAPVSVHQGPPGGSGAPGGPGGGMPGMGGGH